MKKYLVILLAAVAFASCTQNEITPLVAEGVEIKLLSTTEDASVVSTRAPFEGAISATNTLNARVMASLTPNFAGSPYLNGTMTFKGASATSYDAGFSGNTTATFPDDLNEVYLFGLYPSTWSYTNGGGANITFTGKDDIMATEKISTKKQDVVTADYKTLSFKHLLTRLEVKLSGVDAAINTIGNITDIKLVGNITGSSNSVKNQVNITNNGPAMTTAFTGTLNSMSFFGMSIVDEQKAFTDNAMAAHTLTTTATPVAYSIVAPVTATAANKEEYYLAIETASSGTKYVAIDLVNAAGEAFENSTAGRAFSISLFFKSNNQIMVDVDVEDWVEEGEWNGEIAID